VFNFTGQVLVFGWPQFTQRSGKLSLGGLLRSLMGISTISIHYLL
jgi:hypothetical protein